MPHLQEECLAYLETVRWDGIPTCPYCGSTNATPYRKEHRYHCNNCFTSYSVTVRTLFHGTRVDLHKWFLAIQIIINTSEKISARHLGERVGVSKNTASSMKRRIHKARTEQYVFFDALSRDLDSFLRQHHLST